MNALTFLLFVSLACCGCTTTRDCQPTDAGAIDGDAGAIQNRTIQDAESPASRSLHSRDAAISAAPDTAQDAANQEVSEPPAPAVPPVDTSDAVNTTRTPATEEPAPSTQRPPIQSDPSDHFDAGRGESEQDAAPDAHSADPPRIANYETCQQDETCQDGSVCEGGVCHPECSSDDYCDDGSACGFLPAGSRSVCLGHCDPMPLAHIPESEWLERMTVMSLQPWSGDFAPCGEGAYCQPGRQDSILSPFPSCIYALYARAEGEPCSTNAECAVGLGCGAGDPNYDSAGHLCRRWCAGEAQCKDGLTGGYCGKGGDADHTTRVGPDSFTVLGMCSQ